MVSVDHFHSTHFTGLPFLPALCRDFRPYKPSPEALLHICREWQIPPNECLMVGDSAKDDVSSSLLARSHCMVSSLQLPQPSGMRDLG